MLPPIRPQPSCICFGPMIWRWSTESLNPGATSSNRWIRRSVYASSSGMWSSSSSAQSAGTHCVNIHTVSMFTQWVPADWADDEDDHMPELEAYTDRLIQRFDDVAPGFKDSVLQRQIIGPKQMQDGWGLIGGNIFHGELTVDQLFHMRPAPEYSDYRTPIRGLYQASSATHAGGGVTGLPGHHCVREIVKDKALKKLR